MSVRSLIFAASAVIVSLGTAASAASVATSTYDAVSHFEGAAQAPEHSLWFSGSSNPKGVDTSSSKPNHFLFENSTAGIGKFSITGAMASLTGIVKNAAGQGFEVMFNLIEIADQSAGRPKNPGLGDASSWTYYKLDTSKANTLTALAGSGLANYNITLADKDYDAQLGIGANDKNAGLLGFSSWVKLTQIGQCTYGCSYSGDFNILLEGDGSSGVIPLPASIAMFPMALGMLGFVGRRRRRKA